MSPLARGAALLTACALASGLGAYAGVTATTVKPVNTPVTNPDSKWLDGCTTDADCAAMDEALQRLYPDTAGEGEVSPDETLPADDGPWARAWEQIDCEFTSPDTVAETPCLVPGDPIDFTDPDGTVHETCQVVLTSDEDSELVCTDDTVWPS